MSILYSLVFSSRCRSTHHKIAVDALRHLRAADAPAWRTLFLNHHAAYLKGAKAPDDQFKDFKNHVLHVREGEWGGAIESAEVWRGRATRALTAGDWAHAAYCAGVMSHYIADPHQPFHTHQTEEEGVIHRAVEWSFAKSYRDFQNMLEQELGGYPDIAVEDGADWLAALIRSGAQLSTQSYETIIDHYDFAKGVKQPKAGLDAEIRGRVAPLVGRAVIALARALDRIIAESGARPPKLGEGAQAFFVALDAPIQMVLAQIDDLGERKRVGAMYDEFKRTGKVRETLPEDDRDVRALYAAEVLHTPLSSLDAKWPREIGTAHVAAKPARRKRPAPAKPAAAAPAPTMPPPAPAAAAPIVVAPTPAAPADPELVLDRPLPKEKASRAAKEKDDPPAFTLQGDSPVEDAPSIGPKTAKRLAGLGVRTVADLLSMSPATAAVLLGARHISAQTIHDWQSQAALACTVPSIKSREAQALVACGVRDAAALAEADPAQLIAALHAWCASEAAERAWGDAPAPTDADVAEWIRRAKSALKRRAA